MLDSLDKFKGDGTDEITIAELLDFINEQAEGEPDATKVHYLQRCVTRSFYSEVKSILSVTPSWESLQTELK